MKSEHKKAIGLIILVALIIPSILATVCYYKDAVQKTEEEVRFVPGNWTAELSIIYNDSEPIKFLEYSSFTGLIVKNDSLMFEEFNIIINNKSVLIDELVILIIPDGAESRASFESQTRTNIWKDENVLIGNNTKSGETKVIVAYVFTDMNVSNDLYDRHAKGYHSSFITDVVELTWIDLTGESLYKTVIINETPCQIRVIPNHTPTVIE